MENQEVTNPNPVNQQNLPNATGVLVLGIISIVTCWCVGIVGLGVGIVALVLAKKANQLYQASPELYTESSYNNMKGGKICAIIGVCLSSLVVLYYIFYFIFIGTVISSMPWEMMNSGY